jgi:hypothetical protein
MTHGGFLLCNPGSLLRMDTAKAGHQTSDMSSEYRPHPQEDLLAVATVDSSLHTFYLLLA